jgi:hypothetical protein
MERKELKEIFETFETRTTKITEMIDFIAAMQKDDFTRTRKILYIITDQLKIESDLLDRDRIRIQMNWIKKAV